MGPYHKASSTSSAAAAAPRSHQQLLSSIKLKHQIEALSKSVQKKQILLQLQLEALELKKLQQAGSNQPPTGDLRASDSLPPMSITDSRADHTSAAQAPEDNMANGLPGTGLPVTGSLGSADPTPSFPQPERLRPPSSQEPIQPGSTLATAPASTFPSSPALSVSSETSVSTPGRASPAMTFRASFPHTTPHLHPTLSGYHAPAPVFRPGAHRWPTKYHPYSYGANMTSTRPRPPAHSFGNGAANRTKSGRFKSSSLKVVHVLGEPFAVVGTKLIRSAQTRLSSKTVMPKEIVVKGQHYGLVPNGNYHRLKPYCVLYHQQGWCRKPCPFRHDPNRVALCPFSLRGQCTRANCQLSHTPTDKNTPVCEYFGTPGGCTNPACPYVHVRLRADAPLCPSFRSGKFCALGKHCPKRHVFVCPEFQQTGQCRREKCRLYHDGARGKQSSTGPRPGRLPAEPGSRPDNGGSNAGEAGSGDEEDDDDDDVNIIPEFAEQSPEEDAFAPDRDSSHESESGESHGDQGGSVGGRSSEGVSRAEDVDDDFDGIGQDGDADGYFDGDGFGYVDEGDGYRSPF
ncbi:uncharacterized protein BJ171DRAFT_517663 [Polychytrium aggregatum]|uniref:uncharacterized protein n=1 Tax=Polychytrium aggregatum TaxID=110093 RepID=UPI0022FEFAC7|nr:uncharacterized protein BJ171DRAFT_517663 [Polychytrium aggregatum]KAI9199752.1 hypothetical protein BJ171DRAFT_517663 [Polychytrium aggregatum]